MELGFPLLHRLFFEFSVLNVDPALLKRCRKNDRKAQFELYQTCYAFMFKICLRYHSSDLDAKQSLNDAFMKICTKLHRFDPSIPFDLWVRKITINTCIDHYRTSKARSEHESVGFEQLNAHTHALDHNEAERQLDAEALRALIRALPPVSRQVFNLAVLDGYTYDEVAELLNISLATCRWHVHASRKFLQEKILSSRELTNSKAI